MWPSAPLRPALSILTTGLLALCFCRSLQGQEPTAPEPRPSLSGIYPHLAMFNDEGECGTGAVVPWANRLWVVTYAPHRPEGSSDRLHEITPSLEQIIRPESIGGTPANRMIHRESQQLFIGPYVIDQAGTVRVIPYSRIFGRPTGNARHLFDPQNKLYLATMEEGLYEIDVTSLAVTELWADEQRPTGRHANLPGYHGKGLYSGQGRLVYANNGEHGKAALTNPAIPSGVLAEWDGRAAAWQVVARNQFTEVTGPGGIFGAERADDPVWSIGWDHRSLILMCLDGGQWHRYRLPKPSHSYDGAHGWNTEWPRIREIGQPGLLMTMHGAFWQFPRDFRPANSSGIRLRSRYLKVVGDFCAWQGKIVLGTDDAARSEFLNKRRAKGTIAPPQSQSNLWFLDPEQLDRLGPAAAAGAVWLREAVAQGTPSDPFLFGTFQRESLLLSHQSPRPVSVQLELDRDGRGVWTPFRTVELPPAANQWIDLSDAPPAAWIRLTTSCDVVGMTAWFNGSDRDPRSEQPTGIFAGLAPRSEGPCTGGTVRARDRNKGTLSLLAMQSDGQTSEELGYYELDASLNLRKVDDPAAREFQRKNAAIPGGVLVEDAASILYVDDRNRRWRIPRGSGWNQREPDANANSGIEGNWTSDPALSGGLPLRVCREVATERDLFHAAGVFYELPAENAGGFAKVNPVATHPWRITDYCSWRGLLVLSGTAPASTTDNPHLIRSDDGKTAVWVGAADDLWQLGRPTGIGGPWCRTAVTPGVPSDPCLMAGFEHKRLELSHQEKGPLQFHLEWDWEGDGNWLRDRTVQVPAGAPLTIDFPEGFAPRWLRIVPERGGVVTARLLFQ